MQLQREKLELNPVFSTAMRHGDHMTGYIRLINFSQKAAPEMRHAIAALQVHYSPVHARMLNVTTSSLFANVLPKSRAR